MRYSPLARITGDWHLGPNLSAPSRLRRNTVICVSASIERPHRFENRKVDNVAFEAHMFTVRRSTANDLPDVCQDEDLHMHIRARSSDLRKRHGIMRDGQI